MPLFPKGPQKCCLRYRKAHHSRLRHEKAVGDSSTMGSSPPSGIVEMDRMMGTQTLPRAMAEKRAVSKKAKRKLLMAKTRRR